MRMSLVLVAGCTAKLTMAAQPDAQVDAIAGHAADATIDTVAIAADAAPDALPQLTASQLVAQWDMFICDSAFACRMQFPGSTSEFASDFGASQADCYALAAQVDVPAVIDGDVASGEIVFDPAEGAVCLAGLGRDCATFWQQGPTGQAPCEMAIVGTVADGGACHDDWDCAWTSGCNAQHQCQPY